MAQQPFCTGPGIIYAGVGGSLGANVPVQIGTCEAGLTVYTYTEWEALYNDLGSSKIPFDDSFQGEYNIMRGNITRWDDVNLQRCMTRPDFTGTPGFYPFGAKGALMKTEGLAYNLWIKFPYTAKAAYSTQRNGYHWITAWLLSPDEMPVGVSPRKIATIWMARDLFNSADGSATLYDDNMNGLPDLS